MFSIFCSAVLLFFSCDLPTEPGPMPTDIIATEFESKLNILGVLRYDRVEGSSFIRVEHTYRYEDVDEQNFSTVVDDAEVTVQYSAGADYAFVFVTGSDLGEVYKSSRCLPGGGENYQLTITADGYPDVTASTTIPYPPVIDSTSLEVSTRNVSFELLSADDVGLYDLFLICENDTLDQRLVPSGENSMHVEFIVPYAAGEPVKAEIYGYDVNLSEYLISAITIKPQTYLETVTTVEGGYGCFGSLSKSVIDFTM